jgi:uncharacterized membrane protein YbaN (DUF454 family)
MTSTPTRPAAPPPIPQYGGPVRWLLIAFGWANVALGFAGVFVPGLPTTVFLLIALWAFSRSSPRFRHWLWTHPRFGPVIRDWHEHKVIPRKAKAAAVATMVGSVLIVTLFVAKTWYGPVVMIAVLTPIAVWIVTRASEAPGEVEAVEEEV